MAAAVGYIGIHLIVAGILVQLYKRRSIYANQDKVRWGREFENPPGSSWPYTPEIEFLGSFLQYWNVFGPRVSGVLLILSMFAFT